MAKIIVFDSGLGSISIIKPIRKKTSADIIYFADQKNFPYGTKSIIRLRKIINSTIVMLEKKFNPDLIVVGSNTPSLLLKNITKKSNIVGVFPPLSDAIKKTKSNSIAILATKSVVESTALKKYVKKYVPKKIKVIKINASQLVELVESGKFIHDKNLCAIKIKQFLNPLLEHDVDVATLSSTHLPFLLSLLKQIFPQVIFLDPASTVVDQIMTKIHKKSKRSTMKIFTSGNVKIFQKRLSNIGIKNRVMKL